MNLESVFDDYFNKVLRDHLKYPEKYTIERLSDRIILKPNQTSVLLSTLKTDQLTKNQLLNLVTNTIQKELPGTSDIYLSSNGVNIQIRFTTWYNDLYITAIELYVLVATFLDEYDLNNFCKAIPYLCEKESFWTELIRTKYQLYYFPRTNIKYNWRHVYQGLDSFLNKVKDSDDSKLIEAAITDVSAKYPSAMKYMILNEIEDLTHNEIKLALEITKDVDILFYALENKVIFIGDAIVNNIAFSNIDILKRILRESWPQKYFNGTTPGINFKSDFLDAYLYTSVRSTQEQVKEYYELLDGAYTPESIGNILGKINIPLQSVEYFLSKLPLVWSDELYKRIHFLFREHSCRRNFELVETLGNAILDHTDPDHRYYMVPVLNALLDFNRLVKMFSI